MCRVDVEFSLVLLALTGRLSLRTDVTVTKCLYFHVFLDRRQSYGLTMLTRYIRSIQGTSGDSTQKHVSHKDHTSENFFAIVQPFMINALPSGLGSLWWPKIFFFFFFAHIACLARSPHLTLITQHQPKVSICAGPPTTPAVARKKHHCSGYGSSERVLQRKKGRMIYFRILRVQLPSQGTWCKIWPQRYTYR